MPVRVEPWGSEYRFGEGFLTQDRLSGVNPVLDAYIVRRLVLGGVSLEDNVPFRMGMTGALLPDVEPETTRAVILVVCQE